MIKNQEIIYNLSFLTYIILSIVIPCFMLITSWFLGIRSNSKNRNKIFESGIESIGDTHIRFSIKFYILVILFIIFDVESLYLYCWSLVIKESGWIGFFESLIFIFMLLIGLFYLYRTGSLNWKEKK